MILCGIGIHYVDTSRMYHVIRGQAVIKLYIFFNMLDVGDRLLASFGQVCLAIAEKNLRNVHLKDSFQSCKELMSGVKACSCTVLFKEQLNCISYFLNICIDKKSAVINVWK